jgi:hypothetical protein
VRLRRWLVPLAAAVANGALLWFFHRRSWHAPDEGNYAHVASRMLHGEILNREVQDVHPGYINFVHEAAFRVFGQDLLSLRYPLVAVSLAQAVLVAMLFGSTAGGGVAGLAASLALTTLGVLQFLNPTTNWYCLGLAVGVAAALAWLPRDRRARLPAIGFLIGMTALFRQLSGILVAAGAVSFLLHEARGPAPGRQAWLGRAVIAVIAVGLAVYLAFATNLAGWVLFGVWPLLLLGRLWRTARVPQGEVVRIIGGLGAGAALAALPLLAYHVAHGSIASWLDDTLAAPAALARLGFLRASLYGWLAVAGLTRLVSWHPTSVLNGFYWAVLPLAGAANGALVAFRSDATEAGPLPFLAVFYAVVSVHFQIPAYLHYTVGLSLASLLLLASRGPSARRRIAVCASLALSCIAVYFHAGQPHTGRLAGMLAGTRTPLVPADPLPHCGLYIDAEERQRYLDLVSLIQRETRPDETILVVPSNAELYFLSDRGNPLRFYNSALGIRDEGALARALARLAERPPRLVIFNPGDKYNTPLSARLMEAVKRRYALIRTAYNLEIYRLSE